MKIIISLLCIFLLSGPLSGHEVRPAVSDIEVSTSAVKLEIRFSAEGILSGIDLSATQDTDEAPEAETYDRLRALSPDALAAMFVESWPGLSGGFRLVTGGLGVPLTLADVKVMPEADPALPRETTAIFSAELPSGNDPVTFAWPREFGPLVLREMAAGEDAYTGFLINGQSSDPIPRSGTASETAGAAFARYLSAGFGHIIPKGLDHILFVLGLFFFSHKFRPLFLQIATFTIALSISLTAASLSALKVPPSIVEPLIAASIVYVAVENVMTTRIGPWRLAMVFAFGLLHGLGLASDLGEVGLDPSRFIAGLIGFNLGAGLGQVAVVVIAFLTVGLWFGHKGWYRRTLAIPASAAIGLVGLYWFVERSLL